MHEPIGVLVPSPELVMVNTPVHC